MCGPFTRMATWREVHAFSQPMALNQADDRIETATPMRFAHIMRLNAHGAASSSSTPSMSVRGRPVSGKLCLRIAGPGHRGHPRPDLFG